MKRAVSATMIFAQEAAALLALSAFIFAVVVSTAPKLPI